MRSLALAGALVALGIAFFAVRPARTPGPVMRDFEAYYAAGSSRLAGDDPYSREIWRAERRVPGVIASRDELLPFAGPPFGLPLWEMLAQLDYAHATLVWGVVLALGFVTLGLGSLAIASGPIPPREWLAVLVLGGAFGPLTSGMALGQVAVVASAATVGTLLLLRLRNLLPAAFCASLAALQPNIGITLAAALRDRRTAIALGFAATIAVGGSALELGGFAPLLRYLALLGEHAGAERFIAIQTTPSAVARALGADERVAQTIAIALAVAVLVALVAQCLSRRYDQAGCVALACAAVPLALPFAHEHDFTIAFLPAVVCLRRASGAWRVWSVAATLAVAVDWLGLAQRPSGLPATLWLALAAALAAFALIPWNPRPLHLLALLAAPGAVALADALAVAHPLAVWPDALPRVFHAALTLAPAEVWRQEQLASGIARLDPVWGALRLVPLAGCAVLWSIASFSLRPRPANVPPAARASGPR
jgi:hypothetical protein